jgi:hypothetical protein
VCRGDFFGNVPAGRDFDLIFVTVSLPRVTSRIVDDLAELSSAA